MSDEHPQDIVGKDPLGVSDEFPELVRQWWSWVLASPLPRNPVTDPTGARAGDNQPDGPVWLVAGTMGDAVEREWAMPAGRRLFLPVLCGITVPWLFFGRSMDLGVVRAHATLNGQPLEIVPALVRKLPVRVAAGNPFIDADEPRDVRVTTAGLWVLTEPLEPGVHDLRFGGECEGGFTLDVRAVILTSPPDAR